MIHLVFRQVPENGPGSKWGGEASEPLYSGSSGRWERNWFRKIPAKSKVLGLWDRARAWRSQGYSHQGRPGRGEVCPNLTANIVRKALGRRVNYRQFMAGVTMDQRPPDCILHAASTSKKKAIIAATMAISPKRQKP